MHNECPQKFDLVQNTWGIWVKTKKQTKTTEMAWLKWLLFNKAHKKGDDFRVKRGFFIPISILKNIYFYASQLLLHSYKITLHYDWNKAAH